MTLVSTNSSASVSTNRWAAVRRRVFLLLLLLIAALLRPCHAGPERLIWIVPDSLRADHLQYAGYERDTSPWLDALAAESVDFRLAIAPADMTHLSVPAYFTGRRFSQLHHNPLNLDAKGQWLPQNATTLPEHFQAAGFRTLAWTTNRVTTPEAGFAQGFDEFTQLYPHGAPAAPIDAVIGDVRERYARRDTREVIYIHLMDTHLPYRPPLPYDHMFAPAYMRDVVREGAVFDESGEYVLGNHPYFSQNHDVQPEDIAFLISQYDGAIRYLDAKLPELLNALRFDPAQDLLVVHADHGEQFFEHGFWSHGKSTLIEEIHVPLILRYDPFQPRIVEDPVSLLDLYPTLCDVFGMDAPEGLAGTSLMPTLQGDTQSARCVFSEGYDYRGPSGCVVGEGHLYYVNTEFWRREPWRVWPRVEWLFNLESDPACLHDISLEKRDVADQMNAAMRRLNRRLIHCEPSVLRGSEAEVTLGPNLFELTPKGHLAWHFSKPIASRENNDPRAAALTSPWAHCALDAHTPATRRVHLFELDYTLDSASLRIELRNPHNVIHEYCFRKPTDGVARHRAMVVPRTEKTTLRVWIDGYGSARITDARIRRPDLHDIPILKGQPAQTEKTVPPQELTDQEKAKMKALGYL